MNYKSGIIMLVFLLCALGLVTGIKYFNYTKNDPSFCTMCHLTSEGYSSWEKSSHYQMICQECHRMNVVEGNKLLLGYYVKGDSKVKQTHGREEPWNTCLQCHNREAAQGSVTFRNSYGHALHVFMKKVNCNQCHSGALHSMKVESANCRTCHSDKLVHGMGTAGTACLNCHNFSEKSEHMVSDKRCFSCHEDLPREGIMSSLRCHDCHHPHTKPRIESKDCLGECHSSEVKVGQHSLHMGQARLECLDCHKPHSWEIKKANAKGLCDRCHGLKDPVTFIY